MSISLVDRKSLEHSHKAIRLRPYLFTFLFLFFPSHLHTSLLFFLSSFLGPFLPGGFFTLDQLFHFLFFHSILFSWIYLHDPGFPPSILDLVLFTLPYLNPVARPGCPPRFSQYRVLLQLFHPLSQSIHPLETGLPTIRFSAVQEKGISASTFIE